MRVEVTTGSRLHFGLWALGDSPRAFGGVGVMVAEPALRLEVVAAPEFGTTGLYADRVASFAQAAAREFFDGKLPNCEIRVREAPPEHAGLGLGTQLGLAVAAGLSAWVSGEQRSIEQLAISVGRANRSSVGSHGFARGGLIVDGGHSSDAVGAVEAACPMPDDWRMVLVRAPGAGGVSGDSERRAFAELPAIAPETTAELRRLALEELAPAVGCADFAAFAGAVGAYGRLAGEQFAAVQRGAFASPEIERLVEKLNRLGAAGAGQSSWGPTVFAPARSEAHAEELVSGLRRDPQYAEASVTVTRFLNHGAQVSRGS